MDFGSILSGIKNTISPYLFPRVPLISPDPADAKTNPATPAFTPGYQELQKQGAFNPPPQTVDIPALGQFLSDAASRVGGYFANKLPSSTTRVVFRPPSVPSAVADSSSPVPAVASPTPSPMPSPPPSDLEGVIKSALAAYGNPPIATLSGELARAGEGLPDPLLPAILALKESSGGKRQTHNNNPLNVLDPRGFDYPSPESSITGQHGDNRWSFQELLNESPTYAGYKNSGDLGDFFSHYTPPGGSNDSIPGQIATYNELKRKYFAPYMAQ